MISASLFMSLTLVLARTTRKRKKTAAGKQAARVLPVPGVKVQKFGEWEKLRRILDKLPERFDAACRQAVLAEAQALRGHMVRNLTSGGTHAGKPFAPLSPLTLVMRKLRGIGGSKPLNATRGLAAQVSVVRHAAGAFVGIRRGAAHKSGVANLAQIHEFGATVQIPKTKKMIRFLAAAFRAAGIPFGEPGRVGQPSLIVVRVKARPFISPVLDRFGQPDDVSRRFWERVASNLGGDLGK
jgi:hypothetical protein